MASHFWIGGTGNWSDTSHWSLTSGGAGGTAVPTSSDSVTIDANSGATATITVDVPGAICASLSIGNTVKILDTVGLTVVGNVSNNSSSGGGESILINGQTQRWGGYNRSTSHTVFIDFGAGGSLTITGSTFNCGTGSTGTQWNNLGGSGSLYLTGANTVWTYNNSGHTMANIDVYLNGTGTVSMVGGSGTVITPRTLTANQNVTGTNLRIGGGALNMGNGTTWTTTGIGGTNAFAVTASTVVNPGTSTIIIAPSSAGTALVDTLGQTFYAISVILGAGQGASISNSATSSSTFTNLSVTTASAATLTLAASSTITVTGTATLSGAAGQLLSVVSSTPGTQATIALGAVGVATITFASLQDIAITGTHTPVLAYSSVDATNNSGVSFVATAVAVGGNWSASTTWDTGAVPTSSTDVRLAPASGSVTIDVTAACRSLDCTGYTGTLTQSAGLTVGDALGGAFTLSATMTYTSSASTPLTFAATSDNGGVGWSITLAGKNNSGVVSFNGVGGRWRLVDTFKASSTRNMGFSNGTLDLNGQTMNIGGFNSTGSGTRALVGPGTINLLVSNSTFFWQVSGSLGFDRSISLVLAQSNAHSFQGGGLHYGSVSYSPSGTNALTITDSGNTFDSLTLTATSAKQIVLPAGGNLKVTKRLTLSGNLNFVSSSSGTVTTLEIGSVCKPSVGPSVTKTSDVIFQWDNGGAIQTTILGAIEPVLATSGVIAYSVTALEPTLSVTGLEPVLSTGVVETAYTVAAVEPAYTTTVSDPSYAATAQELEY